MRRRGLSEVVTTVIIILIVLAAVVLIWTAVRPTLENAADQVGSDCFTLSLEVDSCTVSSTAVPTTSVRVKRNAGAGDLTGISLVFENGNVVRNETIVLQELETRTIVLPSDYNGQTVDVAGLVGDDRQVCSPANQPVVCERV